MTSPTPQPEAAMRGYRYKHGDRPLEGYTIQRAAGRGGFGEVYAATSDGGREVALKVVHTFEQMELRGIGQCMNLKSPHLVSIFDVRTGEEGQPIVIMEFVSGPSLRELLDEAPSGLGTQKAAFFLREIGKGLTYLHDCGIVHRDLKPANIFYENGYVKIGDYGLSKAISASHRSGQTMTVGTVHYMAPEIGAGRYDRSIDIYALGVLLYEMLTGHPPFYGASTAEVLMKHLGTTVDVSGLPEPFAAVVRKAMAKDPAERYETTQQMVEAVFGAEHVRQSVSCFSPDHLTLVAGRVADRAGIRAGLGFGAPGRPISSGAYDVAADERDAAHEPMNWAERMGARIGRLAEGVAGIGDTIAALLGGGSKPAATLSESTLESDPMSRGHRLLLAVVSLGAVAVAAGIFASGSSEFQPPHVAMFCFLCTAGATLGVGWSTRRLMPALQAEAWFLRQLATGGVAAILAILVSLPTWGPPGRGARQIGECLGAISISLLLIDWQKRTRPDRRERVSLGSVVNCAVVALVVGAILDINVPLVIAVMCGVSIVAQIASPWIPAAAWRRREERQAAKARSQAPMPQPQLPPLGNPLPAAHEAAAQAEGDPLNPVTKENGMAVTRVNLGPLKIFSSAPAFPPKRQRDPADGSLLGSMIRLPFVLLSTALLLAAFIVGCALAFDLPGWMASGRLEPSITRDLREQFGTIEWPRVLRILMGMGMFITTVIGATILMLLRRRQGVHHMLRTVAGIGLLLSAPFFLVERHPLWDAALPMRSGDWVLVLDGFLNHVTPHTAFAAGCAFAGGWLLLLWPAKRRATKVPASPSLPAPAPAGPVEKN